jgi:hypothetical protein
VHPSQSQPTSIHIQKQNPIHLLWH